MNTLVKILMLLVALSPVTASAQQSKQFGDYTIHYNALNSSLIAPEVAKAYNIRRSDSRGLVNIAVLKNVDGQPLPVAVKALVTVSARNLTGQTREVDMREINESGGAIYYIGELSVRNMETFSFTAMVTPESQGRAYELKFNQQFYTE